MAEARAGELGPIHDVAREVEDAPVARQAADEMLARAILDAEELGAMGAGSFLL